MEKAVKVIVTCGHPDSGFHIIHETLVAAELAHAQPSQLEAISATALQERLLRARESSLAKGLTADHGLSSKLWHDLATDLFKGNSAGRDWGWADARATWLLEFWKSFDPAIRFILVYSAPELTIAKMLEATDATPDNVTHAVTSWMTYNTELLRFYNRNRELCMLVNARTVMHAPAHFVNKVAATTGARLTPISHEPELNRADISSVPIILMKALIENFDRAAALYQELESSADFHDAAAPIMEARKSQAWREYLSLLGNLRHTVDERRDLQERAERLQSECVSLAQALTQTQSQVDQLTEALNDARASFAAKQADMGQLQSRNTGLIHENELLMLQVRQIREELEYQVAKCEQHEANFRRAMQQREFQARFMHRHLANVVIDMRQEIDGENWYYPEHDGRWAGPNEVSSVRMPALGQGTYEGQLDVTDSMDAEILRRTELSFNGNPLHLSNDCANYPALVTFLFTVDDIESCPIWEFQLKFPKLISPAQLGSDDRRNLAIKLRSMKVGVIP
jgi:hypothetical protein